MRAHPDLPPPSLAERVRATLAGEGRPPSRTRVEAWIRAGAVRVDGLPARDPALPVAASARVSVDLDDLDLDDLEVPGGTVSRGVGGERPEPPPRALPPGVLHADAHLVVVDRAAFPGATSPEALAAEVSRALSASSRRPVVLLPVPDPSQPGSGPVLLASSKACAARLSAMVREGQVEETLLSLRTPPTLGPGESILEQGDARPDGSPFSWTLVERSDAPLAPPPPGTRALAPPHRAVLTLKHPKSNRLLEFALPLPAGWPRWEAPPRAP